MKTIFVTSIKFDKQTSIRLSDSEIQNLAGLQTFQKPMATQSKILSGFYDQFLQQDNDKNFTQFVRNRINDFLSEVLLSNLGIQEVELEDNLLDRIHSEPSWAMKYYVKSEKGYWRSHASGYSQNINSAYAFEFNELEKFNLDGCTLERANE